MNNLREILDSLKKGRFVIAGIGIGFGNGEETRSENRDRE
jgi:hypothetical protein